MSEPSSEAKQAAMEAANELARLQMIRESDTLDCAAILRRHYDTATAKARKELVKIQELVLQRDSEIAQLKWKMQEVDKALWDEAKPKGYEPDRAEAIRAVRKLAHQPPLDSAASTSSGQARDKQPSAPTADVEKIASNAVAQWCLASRNWTGYDMPDQQQKRLSEIMTKALAQACAPLVAAAFDKLRSILKERSKGEVDTWGFVATFMDMIDEAERAALIGTGEISRVKEGETTTTQKGDKQESDIIR